MRATSNVTRAANAELDHVYTHRPGNLIPLRVEENDRLPVYGSRPNLYEKIAFGTLHLVAVAVIGLTAYDSLRFAMLPNGIGFEGVSSNMITAVAPTNAPALPDGGLQRQVEQTAGLPRVQPPKS